MDDVTINMGWLGGMSPSSQAIQEEHHEKLQGLLEKAKAEDKEKARLKAEKKVQQKAAKAAGAAASGGRRFSLRRPSTSVKKHDKMIPENSGVGSPSATSRRVSVQYIRSESPPGLAKRSPLNNVFDASLDKSNSGTRDRSRSATSSTMASDATDSMRSSDHISKGFWASPWTRNRQKPSLSSLSGAATSPSDLERTAPPNAGGGDTDDGRYEECSYPPLIDVLSNKSAAPFDLNSFLRFAKRHWMDENILFYLEVKAFKMSGGGEVEYLTDVKRIYDLYITPTSPREVNIGGALNISISAVVSSILRGRVGHGEAFAIPKPVQTSGSRDTTRSDSKGDEGTTEKNDDRREVPTQIPPKPTTVPDVSTDTSGTDQGLEDLSMATDTQPAVGAASDDSESSNELTQRRRSCRHVQEDSFEYTLRTDDSSCQIEEGWGMADFDCLLEFGEGGGFGDRTIFDEAQREIAQLLARDAYPKFVLRCFARNAKDEHKLQRNMENRRGIEMQDGLTECR